MNETQKAVDAYLESEKIDFSVRYVGETVREDKWQCDAWRVSFASGKSQFETDYYTGLGHRQETKSQATKTIKIVGNKWVYAKPVQPCAANVLYSLIQDSSAIDTSFEYWCADYGYDSDSISAFNTYQACCRIAKELLRVFTRAQLETLRGLLEDYWRIIKNDRLGRIP